MNKLTDEVKNWRIQNLRICRAEGLSNKQISAKLNLSTWTISRIKKYRELPCIPEQRHEDVELKMSSPTFRTIRVDTTSNEDREKERKRLIDEMMQQRTITHWW